MKRIGSAAAGVLLAAAFGIGCGGGGAAKTETAAKTDQAAQSMPAGDAAGTVEAAPGMIKAPDAVATVSVAGHLGCGHCTFHVKESCTLAMKADDGTVYLLETGDEQETLMGKRYDEPAVLVAGRVSEVDGQKIIYADTVEMR